MAESHDHHQSELLLTLQRLGVPSYEAKAYLALLAAGEPMNGYEVAKYSGVPRSTVYETLTKLARRELVYEVQDSDNQTKYLPLSSGDLLLRLRRDFEGEIGELENGLAEWAQQPTTHLVHRLAGEQMVLNRATDLIQGAQRSIHVTAWPNRLKVLEPYLREAEQRGVSVWVHVWQGGTADLRHVFTNPLTEPGSPFDRTSWLERRVGTQLLVLVADSQAMITAGTTGSDLAGIYSDDPATVLLGMEAIVHYIIADTAIAAMGPSHFIEMWDADPARVQLAYGYTDKHGEPRTQKSESEPRFGSFAWPREDADSRQGHRRVEDGPEVE